MKKSPETLLEVLESTLAAQKTYEEIVADGAAVERLQQNQDFKRFQRLMNEAYLALIERLRLADPATLPALQGALIQHANIIKLPSKILEAAVRMVEQNRQERESADAER